MIKEVKSIASGKVDQPTVDLLKELLAKAELGEMNSLIYIDGYRDGEVGCGWSGRPTMRMIAAIEETKFQFFSQMFFSVEE